jgi:hypothetical protein
MKSKLIGFAGKARAGKTTSAQIWTCLSINPKMKPSSIAMVVDSWEDYHPYVAYKSPKIVSFADPLRKIAEIITGISEESWKSPSVKNSKLRAPYDNYTGREFLEYLGTEVLRDNLSEDVHINACHIANSSENRIFDDLRLPNEAEYIKSNGGTIIRIIGKGEDRAHKSGIPLPSELVDIEVDNSKTISYLAGQLKEIYNAKSK